MNVNGNEPIEIVGAIVMHIGKDRSLTGIEGLGNTHFPIRVYEIPKDLVTKMERSGIKWNCALEIGESVFFMHGIYDASLIPENEVVIERDGQCGSLLTMKRHNKWLTVKPTKPDQRTFLEYLGELTHLYIELDQFYT